MRYIADLHTHSSASDGQYRPAELVCLAKERGLEVMALTDHDTLDGLDEAIEAGRKLGLKVIRGVELSADEYPNLHILGHGFPREASGLREQCENFKHRREHRKYRIQEYLQLNNLNSILNYWTVKSSLKQNFLKSSEKSLKCEISNPA